MYLDHFGLNRPPFKITPDTTLFFEGSQRGAALGALTFAIKSGEGIIKVVGEVGSGKTMLCRMLEVKLSNEVDIVYIANPSLSPDNILHVIAHELEIEIASDASKFDVMQKIQVYLLQKHADNRQVVMFVEEAQSMPVETLEEIRLLSNLETDQNKLLQMVLFGQPELDEKLSLNHIRQLKERITHSFKLAPFLPEDTFEYLNFRMRAVGYRGPDIFNQKVSAVVKKYSNGLTRRINILADKSLMAAFSEGKHQVEIKHVKIAANDSEFEKGSDNNNFIYTALAVACLVFAVWLGTLLPSHINNIETNDAVVIVQNQQKASFKQSSTLAIKDKNTGGQLQKNNLSLAVKISPKVLVEKIVQSKSKNTVTDEIFNKSLNVDSQIDEIEDIRLASSDISDLLKNRLSVTKQWLAQVGIKKYSIQLFLTRVDHEDKITAFLANVPESLDFNRIYIYETKLNRQRVYGVLYDDFASFTKAVSKINELKKDFPLSKPFVRRVRDVRLISDV